MLISSAYAQAQAAAQPGGGFEQIFLIILMCAGMYFFFIRPQNKKAKEHKTMVEGLAKGIGYNKCVYWKLKEILEEK